MFAQPLPQFMASLPAVRLEPRSYAFVNVGVDYMGPFTVKIGRRNEKRWVCLFTCLVVRAVHLEVAHRLDTDSFLQCFQRFIDRRGYPSSVCSDNGTNLTSGERELREGLQNLDQEKISDSLSSRSIQWSFSTPAAPHFGGAWERLVRSSKIALRAIIGPRNVANDVLHTVVTDIEALLNARPLTHLSVDPDDLEPLTPNHFLLGRASPHLPLDVVDQGEVVSRRKFRAIQALMNSFWRRWMTEYAPHLTERKKWLANRRNLQIGDVVLIVDPNSLRGTWPIGRVEAVHPGPDGIVRSTTVKTLSGSYNRPVVKLCVLQISDEDSFESEARAGDVVDE